MLSALIPSERRYSALRLTPQPIHGRFVPSGPLVSLFPYFYEPRLYLHPIVDFRFLNHSLTLLVGVGVLSRPAIKRDGFCSFEQSRYGDNLKIFFISESEYFLWEEK